MDEFAIINSYFTGLGPDLPEVLEAQGDDCALLQIKPGELLALSVDTSVVDRHFPAQADPWAIGWRCLAIALSDLAAMAARPLGFTLAITLPEAEDAWLAEFSRGMRALADKAACPLIGGDTTRGSLSMSVQVHGAVKSQHHWRRSGARPGQIIVLLGNLGLAHLGLLAMQADPTKAQDRQTWNRAEQAYMLPEPLVTEALRLAQGVKIHAAIDVSDGLLADLQHLLASSAVGAKIDLNRLPVQAELKEKLGAEAALQATLQGGDDYALLMTLEEKDFELARSLCPNLVSIGECVAGAGIRTLEGKVLDPQGFNHFLPQAFNE
ncbi:thiamine-phosphate kinase [Marinospirillum insulare]|uniref:Thiamine-monophosphate kinase n=1 Tax=Marinospirillum insulare TaxID=217169 RepID=A0ABQ5ZVL9_9GAMM|nr:thiamine-phosphate kinase [Marinospirillum insulare]GLR63353.1 thiamine-monophosphate kinase [Marinospirillum insulare]